MSTTYAPHYGFISRRGSICDYRPLFLDSSRARESLLHSSIKESTRHRVTKDRDRFHECLTIPSSRRYTVPCAPSTHKSLRATSKNRWNELTATREMKSSASRFKTGKHDRLCVISLTSRFLEITIVFREIFVPLLSSPSSLKRENFPPLLWFAYSSYFARQRVAFITRV